MDNTVGSLTQLQKSLIIGTLLGDGYLRIMKNRKNAFLEVNHSNKQKEYVDWKYDILKNIVKSPPSFRNGNNKRIAYRFFTRQVSELTDMYHLFYKDKIKVVPNIEITPMILAVWFMDDGSKSRCSDVYLNTQQFNYNEQLKLIQMLGNIGLEARLNKDKQYYRIRFIKKSLPRLVDLISNFIIPSMRYKIEL